MADEVLVTNLFGDIVQPRSTGRGRPPVVWDREKSNKVLLAFVRGLSVLEAAKSVGMSEPTLRKVYFSEVAVRDQARLRMEQHQLARLNALAEAGNVSAEKELFKMLDKLRQRDVSQSMTVPPPAKREKLGKKAAAAAAAEQVRGLYEPRPGPTQH